MTLPLPALPVDPVRCRNPLCRRWLRDPRSVALGFGRQCAEERGLVAPRRLRWPVVHGEAADTPNLFDLINEGVLMTDIDPKRVLGVPLGPNDAGAATVRSYLVALLAALWEEGEGFSGKRPFGNSSWEHELYLPLVKAGLVRGDLDEDGYLDTFERDEADELISAAIQALGDA